MAGIGLEPAGPNVHCCQTADRVPHEGYLAELFKPCWFVFRKGDGTIRCLGCASMPVGAMDLEGAGVSDWLFQNTDSEKDGYRLFYDGLTKAVTFSWIYH